MRARVDLATVRAYLFTIARNVYLTHRKHAARSASLDERWADGQPGPDVRAQARQDLDAVLRALQTLPEIDRAALLMRADDGVSYEEVARALGISTVAARVKVHRARLKLAEARLSGAAPVIRKETNR